MIIKYCNAKILKNNQWIPQDFTVCDGIIVDQPADTTIDLSGCLVAPSLFDIHTHGGNGYDFNTADEQGILTILQHYASNGVGQVLATIMTDSLENMKRQLVLIAKISNTNHMLAGIHLESCFLSPEYKGAMNEQYLLLPSIEIFDQLQAAAQGLIRLVTLSPELIGATELTRYLTANGVVVSLGHSGATYEQTQACIDAGAKSFTHIFNAMSHINHHEPNIVVNALSGDNYCEAIVDGKHLAPELVKMVYKAKTNKLIAITDSIMASGMPDGTYTLANTPIIVTNGDAKLTDNETRAGSTLTAWQGVCNLAKYCNIPLSEAIASMTVAPSNLLGLNYCTFETNSKADFLIILDNKVIANYNKGEIIFDNRK